MKLNFSKEQLEYELVIKHFELRDGELWRKEFVSKQGRVYPARPVTGIAVNSKGYLQVKVEGKLISIHRIIFILTHNRPIREGYIIDHRYGNILDNSPENLRELTFRENNRNQKKHREGHLPGTSKCKKTGKWQAHIHVNDKKYYLGLYDTQLEAHLAYMAAYELIEPIPAHIAGKFTSVELRHAVKNILAHNSLKLQERPNALSSMCV